VFSRAARKRHRQPFGVFDEETNKESVGISGTWIVPHSTFSTEKICSDVTYDLDLHNRGLAHPDHL
jgi:hypothetical protein